MRANEAMPPIRRAKTILPICLRHPDHPPRPLTSARDSPDSATRLADNLALFTALGDGWSVPSSGSGPGVQDGGIGTSVELKPHVVTTQSGGPALTGVQSATLTVGA